MSLTIPAFMVLVAHLLIITSSYNSLPASIPLHFNAQGIPDGWGKKQMIWLLPVIAAICLGLMYFAAKTGNINAPNNLDRNDLVYMLSHLTFSTQVIFLLVSYFSIQVANSKREGLGRSFFFIVLFLILYPFFFLIKASI